MIYARPINDPKGNVRNHLRVILGFSKRTLVTVAMIFAQMNQKFTRARI